MCGRFTNQYAWRELVDLYRITEPYIHPISNLEPRFNFAPMQRGVVVRLDKEGRREPVIMRWGPVPTWSKDHRSATARAGRPARSPGCGNGGGRRKPRGTNLGLRRSRS